MTRPVAACHPPLAYETDARGRSLAEALVADAHGGDALPLLQMTLQRLFDAEAARGDGVLRFADYPGLDVAVARTAEEAVAGLDARAVSLLPALITAFVRDVTFGTDGGIETLTIVPVERDAFERGDPVRRALIDEFISRRLLTAEEAGGVVRLRPVHEALLRVVPAAVAIIKENAALIRVRNTLAPMAAEWSQAPADRKADFLATSPALIAGAAQLDERFGPELPASMRAFIAELLAADARRRDAERSRQRRILAATAAGLVVALVLAGIAGWQWRVAAEQRQIAELQRARAENALAAATRTDQYADLRSGAGIPPADRNAGRPDPAHPRTGAGFAAAARGSGRAHLDLLRSRSRGARRTGLALSRSGRPEGGAGGLRARPRHPAGDGRALSRRSSCCGASWRSR